MKRLLRGRRIWTLIVPVAIALGVTTAAGATSGCVTHDVHCCPGETGLCHTHPINYDNWDHCS